MLTEAGWLTRRRLAVLVLLAGVVAAIAGVAAHATLGGIERAALDVRYQLRGSGPADPRIVVIGIDDATLESEQLQPPYPRLLHAKVLNELRRAGVATVAYDLAFTGATDPMNDGALLRALDRAARPVVGVVGLSPHSSEPAMLAGQVPLPSDRVMPGNTARDDDRFGSWTEFTSRVEDLDAFAVVAAARFLGRTPAPAPARALIDYPDSGHPFRYFSYSDVLDHAVPHDALRGKLVVVGNVAAQLQDNHATPFGTRAGPELQAAAIATALNGYPLRGASTPVAAAAVGAAAFALPFALLLGAAGARWRRRGRGDVRERALLSIEAVVGLGLAVALGWLVAVQVAFHRGLALDATAGLVAVLVATLLAAALARADERRVNADLRRRFAEGNDDLIRRALGDDGERGPVGDLAGLIAGITLLERRTDGATGIVYRARQEFIEREIAVKVIRSSLVASARARELFYAESRSLGRLWHPHVVPIFEVGDDRDVFYIAMRWIGGGDLSDIATPAAPADVAVIVRGVAAALDAAHAAGIIHGDVKPENVLLDPHESRHPYLIDFGIALVDADGAVAVGKTPHYASPEAFSGEELTHRSDVYALGVLAFWLLTGEVPFEGNAQQLAALHTTAPRPAPSEFDASLTPAVDAVVQHAMSIRPAERPPSAGEFAAALAQALEEG